MLKIVYAGLNDQTFVWRLKCSKMCMKAQMLVPKCIYLKCIFAKCTRLACLLSFASLLVCWEPLHVFGAFPKLHLSCIVFLRDHWPDTKHHYEVCTNHMQYKNQHNTCSINQMAKQSKLTTTLRDTVKTLPGISQFWRHLWPRSTAVCWVLTHLFVKIRCFDRWWDHSRKDPKTNICNLVISVVSGVFWVSGIWIRGILRYFEKDLVTYWISLLSV